MRIRIIQKIIDRLRGKQQVQGPPLEETLHHALIEKMMLLSKARYSGGQRWELELEERYKSKLYLERYGYKVFSQNDEDGMIDEIFNRIGTTNKTFIEFGVQDGLECNSHLLLTIGWKGLWIDGSATDCNKIKKAFRTSIDRRKLTILNEFITKDNINALFDNAGFSGELDFLSVDIDGNDWHVLKSILEGKQVNPRVICVEYNSLLPPARDPNDESTDWIMEYKEDWRWVYDDCQGASLSAYYRLCKNHGYRLVGTSVIGSNAFFVREDLVGDKFVSDENGALALYNPGRWHALTYMKPHHKGVVNLNESMENRIKIYEENQWL